MGKKVAVIFASVLFFCTCFVGCNNEYKQTTAGSDEKNVTELSWYINFSWFTSKWGGNVVSDAITEKTGVSINFITPSGDSSDKLNSMLDANSLPDLVTLGWWEGKISEIIDKKLVYPLDELADKYDTYFWKVANDQTLQWYKSDDGHIYQYPNSSFSPSDYEEYDTLASNETFLVRKDIYEAIGRPDMTTPEGFVKAVRKAAKMFPTIDGNKMIPVGSHEFIGTGCDSFDVFLCDFLAIPYMKDGRAYDRITDPEYIKWLKAFRKLGAEGLLKDDIFLDTRTQMDEKIKKGQYFCMLYQRTDLSDAEMSLYNNNPDSIYIAIDGPRNSNGDTYKLPGTSINGWTITMISKNCKDPQKAIKLMTYMISEEGQLMTWLGVEGKTWEYDSEGVPRMKDNVKKLLDEDRGAFDKKYGADSCYWMFQNNAIATKWIKDDENSPLTQLKEWTYPYTCYNGQYLITFPSDSEGYKLRQSADEQWGKVLPKLLLCKSDEEFDQIYSDFIKERYDSGYGKVLDLLTVEMKKNIKKLGLKDE